MDFINSVFNELNNMFYGQGGYKSFPLDLVEIKDGFTVIAELPGVNKEDIQMSFEDGILTIEADRKKDADAKYLINERDVMHLKRSINFGDIHEDTISAKLENGLLTVTIMTKVPEEKPKRSISIE
ncbi:MAG: Hsp20 family protein [Anaeroplasmataceae bacterium]|nr:Hsp20 family protein [Anaeroplasmataceae bacterium]